MIGADEVTGTCAELGLGGICDFIAPGIGGGGINGIPEKPCGAYGLTTPGI
jgi:hypothetical protein